MAHITISLGHGLRGLLPGISGTVGLLSLWENGVEGHLPQLHMKNTGTLLLYSNTAPLRRDFNVNFIPLAHWQPFRSAATCPDVDHPGRAANRHVLQVKSAEHTFHHAPLLWRLLLRFGSDPAEKKSLALVWSFCTLQVGMVRDLPATEPPS
eukprot:6458191-Amphidinium_carterae.1